MPFRPPTLDDADAIVALLVACDIADFGAPDYDHAALMEEWSTPGVDPAHDAFITDGAYGLLLGHDARAWVHPGRRGREGLEGALTDRLEARARERGLDHVDRQVPRRDPAQLAALQERGYELVRHYAAMRLADSAVAGLPAPDGVRAYDPGRDAEAVQALMERAFAGGAGRLEPLATLLARNPDTSLWWVADAPGAPGRLAGALRAELRPAGFITGYVTQVAVDEPFRGQGLGGRLIGAAARELVARGAVAVRLHVRSSNPGALRLYERPGFTGSWEVDELRKQLGR